MVRKWLRFPLGSFDQLRADAAKITVVDGSPGHPDWLRLEFQVDPELGAPELQPLFPGSMRFQADPQAPGVLPKATDPFTWTDTEYESWRTVGRLVVSLDPYLVHDISTLPDAPAPIPTVAWYWPVRLTRDFLLDSVRTHLVRADVKRAGGGVIKTDAPNWPQHALSGFLSGSHTLELRRPSDPAQDDAVRFAMPTVEMDADGSVGLWVAVAAGSGTHDGTAPPDVPGTTRLLDPAHAANALLHARRTLTVLRDQMLDAEQPGSPLVSSALPTAPWPQAPRYFPIAFSTPGAPERIYLSGLLPATQVRVTQAGTILQERRLPTCGIVTLTQEPANPPSDPPVVRVKLVAGSLRIAETNGTRLGLPADEVEFNFATLAEPARVVLQHPRPNLADPAARAAYSTRLATLSLRLGRSGITDDAVAQKLVEYEGPLRPSTWSPSDRVFRGSRAPRKGDRINGVDVPGVELRDLRALFDALQSLSIAPGSPPIRPGEAMVLWVMEGRLALGADDLLHPGEATDFFPLSSGSIPHFPFGPVAFEAAPDSEVRTLLRSLLLWDAWGMDVVASTVHVPADEDTRLAWESTLSASVAAHDTKLRAGLQAMTAAGITPPTEKALNDTFELTRTGGVRRFRLLPEYIQTMLWLQHADYLRRQVSYVDSQRTDPFPAMPVTARNSPAFNYIAYNGGIKRAAELWQKADEVLTSGPPAWVKTHEDALRSWQLDVEEVKRTPRGGNKRSTASRVNGVHFAALVRTYGAIFPRVLYP